MLHLSCTSRSVGSMSIGFPARSPLRRWERSRLRCAARVLRPRVLVDEGSSPVSIRASKDRCRAPKRIGFSQLWLFRDTGRAYHPSLIGRGAIVPKPAEIDKGGQWSEEWKGHADLESSIVSLVHLCGLVFSTATSAVTFHSVNLGANL
jgi:hypothetical protein